MKNRHHRSTILGSLAETVSKVHEAHMGARWPSPKWQADPVGFAHYVLGVRLWAFQIAFLEAIRDNRHVAVAGGRKIGKDFAVAVAALWWYASFENSRVLLLAPTSKQLDGIVYREIRMLYAGAGRCLECKRSDPEAPRPCPHSAILTGKMGLLARNGVRDGFREIVGMTAVNEGGLRGMSGARILAIEDEASDIKDEFDTALIGNLAGADCHRVIISNPTKSWGFFYRAFHQERDLYFSMTISTESNPNIIEGRDVYRGLADRQWLREREIAWGRGSIHWSANVEGQFPKAEEGQLFTLEAITLASSAERYESADASGPLQLGIDVAGEGQQGDESAFCIRRGRKVLDSIEAVRGLTPDAILDRARGLLTRHRTEDDGREGMIPIVCVDRDGGTGARVFDVFNAYRVRDGGTEREFRLIGFQGGQPPKGDMGARYRWNRDLLYAGLLEWVRMGGAFPPDLKLEAELVTVRWRQIEGGRSALEPKSEIKERLGRSPDRADALALATWQPAGMYAPATLDAPHEQPPRGGHIPELDPYLDAFAEGGRFDPYAGMTRGSDR
jgi:hypothetical protein